MRIGRGNRSTQRKPAPVPFYPPQIPYDLTWARIGSPRWEAGDYPPELWHGLYLCYLGYVTKECSWTYERIRNYHEHRSYNKLEAMKCIHLWNTETHLSDYMASQPRRLQTESLLLWKFQILSVFSRLRRPIADLVACWIYSFLASADAEWARSGRFQNFQSSLCFVYLTLFSSIGILFCCCTQRDGSHIEDCAISQHDSFEGCLTTM
jgi:hypothetical protein